MLISVITVVYNRKHSIGNTIESVMHQTYQPIEYIIIDGGSSDGTMDVIRNYQSSIDKIISEPDHGMYDALNKGIKIASGTVIGILHSDDIFADDQVIEKIANNFKLDNNLEATYGDVSFVRNHQDKKVVRYFSSKNFNSKKFELGYMPAHPSFFCKKTCFEKFGYYRTDMKIGADFDLLLRFIGIKKIEVRYIPICTTIMTMGGKSTSGIQSLFTINREFYKSLKDNGYKASLLKLYSRYFTKWKEFFAIKK